MDSFKINDWNQTIDELKKEQLSESNPYIDYFKKFFGKKRPVAPVPVSTPPVVSKKTSNAGSKYIQQLDSVLKDSQNKLVDFINSLDLRIIKKNMELIDFTKSPKQYGIHKQIKPKYVKGELTPGEFPLDRPPLPDKAKKKSDLPVNTIFENNSKNWRKKREDLSKVMSDAYQNVSNVLLEMAKDSGHTPNNKNLKSLIMDIKNFNILDKKSAIDIKNKCIVFIKAYKQLEIWLSFFQKTEQNKEKAERK